MARKIWDFKKLCDEMDSAHAAIDPLLNQALVSTIPVDGKPVAASEAPLPAKISALAAATPTVEEAEQGVKQLYVTNSALAAQLEKQTVELATANATVGTLQGEARSLTARATTAEAAVQTLTAEKAQLNVQLKAAMSEFSRVNTDLADANAALSRMCLSYGCLDLKTADGKTLSPEASEAEKLEAANRIPIADKITASKGAVNGALARTGVDINRVPAGGACGAQISVSAQSVLNQYNAISDPSSKVAFYRAHKDAIDAAYREIKKN